MALFFVHLFFPQTHVYVFLLLLVFFILNSHTPTSFHFMYVHSLSTFTLQSLAPSTTKGRSAAATSANADDDAAEEEEEDRPMLLLPPTVIDGAVVAAVAGSGGGSVRSHRERRRRVRGRRAWTCVCV